MTQKKQKKQSESDLFLNKKEKNIPPVSLRNATTANWTSVNAPGDHWGQPTINQ